MAKRQYSDQYLNFGFTELKKKRRICATVSNVLMKPSLLQRHLQTNHPEKKVLVKHVIGNEPTLELNRVS